MNAIARGELCACPLAPAVCLLRKQIKLFEERKMKVFVRTKDWRDRTHLKGEPVCAYLRRYAKDPLWGQKQGVVPTELWLKVAEVYPQVIARYAPLKKTLKRASGSPFRTVVKGEG